MADKNIDGIVESLTKQPIRITNPVDPNAAAPKLEKTLIHNPLAQGKTKDSDEYKSYVKDVFAKLDDYKKSPEYKKAALDAIFGKEDVDYNKFHNDLRSGFLKKYGYDEDLGKIAPGHLGGFDMEWSPTDTQQERTLLAKKNSLTNLISGGLSLDDIRDYFTQQGQAQPKPTVGVGYRGVGNFIRKPLPGELPGSDNYGKNGRPFTIEQVANLTPEQLKEFANDPLADRDYIQKVSRGLGSNPNGDWGTILLDDGQSEYGYVVDPSGYGYGRYVFPIKIR